MFAEVECLLCATPTCVIYFEIEQDQNILVDEVPGICSAS